MMGHCMHSVRASVVLPEEWDQPLWLTGSAQALDDGLFHPTVRECAWLLASPSYPLVALLVLIIMKPLLSFLIHVSLTAGSLSLCL